MKQKGFTLIELLAVIVILAIIAVITVPMIMNVIDKAKIGALEDSAYGMVESANLYYAEKVKEGIEADLTFTPNTDSNGMFAGTEQLNYKGSLPESGSEVLIKTNGNVGVKLISGDYCAVKSTTETKVTILKKNCVTNIDGTTSDSESSVSALQSIIGSTDISGIGDGTITGAISSLDSYNNYMNEEQVIGTWINGKTIYRKVFVSREPLGDLSTDVSYDLGISNVDDVIDMRIISNGGTNMQNFQVDTVVAEGTTYSMTYFFDKNTNLLHVLKKIASTFYENKIKCIIEYTKTID